MKSNMSSKDITEIDRYLEIIDMRSIQEQFKYVANMGNAGGEACDYFFSQLKDQTLFNIIDGLKVDTPYNSQMDYLVESLPEKYMTNGYMRRIIMKYPYILKVLEDRFEHPDLSERVYRLGLKSNPELLLHIPRQHIQMVDVDRYIKEVENPSKFILNIFTNRTPNKVAMMKPLLFFISLPQSLINFDGVPVFMNAYLRELGRELSERTFHEPGDINRAQTLVEYSQSVRPEWDIQPLVDFIEEYYIKHSVTKKCKHDFKCDEFSL